MPLRYPIILILIFMILALSRGFVLQNFGELSPFSVLHALAEGDGGGGAGGDGDGPGDGGPGDVIGCMDPSANNYNPSATSQTGVTCTYTIIGCMDPSATNYNPAATSQTGVTCTYPPTPVCIITINPDTIVAGGSAALAWGFSSDVTSLSINNGIGVKTSRSYSMVSPTTSTTYSGVASSPYGSAVCSASITVTPAPVVPPPPAPIIGCMDPSATNYNPAATSQTGVTCTYPVVPPPPVAIPGCTDSSATNYNPAATTDDGSCTYPVVPPPPVAIPGCTDSSATNYNPAATTDDGSCTYPVVPPPPPLAPLCTLTASPTAIMPGSSSTLSWTTTNATSFNIDSGVGAVTPVAAGSTPISPAVTTAYTGTAVGAGGTVTCTAHVTIAPVGGGAGGPPAASGGGGGGGGSPPPTITLAMLPRVSAQPLAYLYLSQIPYTGLDLGPVGTTVYWTALIGFALALAYLVLFGVVPVANRSLREFGARVLSVLNAGTPEPPVLSHAASSVHVAPPPQKRPVVHEPHIVVSEAPPGMPPEAPPGHSSYDGFKSFAHNGALSIEDIVKSLSRRHPSLDGEHRVEPIEKTEPVYEQVEPVYEHVEPIATEAPSVPASTRGFTAALLEGDRVAVFAGLRQHVRGGGAPEKLVSDVVCLLDDAYRARIDGTSCDADIARLSARLSTPTLEKLVAALTTAIDSSYSTGVTGTKLALTRALSILGA